MGDPLSPFWTLPNWHEIEENLRDIIKKEGIHPVDPITIASKADPFPMKDVRDNWLESISRGQYCGHNSIRKTLLQDMFDAVIENRVYKVSRWVMNVIEPDLRNQANLIKAEGHAQFDKTHGAATLRSGPLSTTPAEDLNNYDGTHRPIIGVRFFHGGAQQVVNDIAYYFCYGFMRCNLSQDAHLEEGIYAYADIEAALSKLDYNLPTDRSKCIGIVEGYLSKRHEDKISLNPRSTKLIAVFPPGTLRFTPLP